MQLETLLDKYSEIFDNRLHQYIDYKLKEDGYDEFYDAMGHIPLTTGKRIRPILAVLSCEAVGGRSDDAMELALAVELLHNASLIHDDIIDGDKKRRNVPTVHEKYGVPIAINVGDALVGEAFYMIAMLPKVRMQKYGLAVVKELFVSFTLATKGLYSGEAQDIEFMDRLDITEEEYMKMVMKKTSSLYMLSTRGGAILGGGNAKEIEELSKFGRDFGIMFQIKDDLLGIVGKEELLGKTVGIDIKGRKRTLYMVHALHNASEKDKSELNKILKRKYMPGDIDLEMEIFERTGSIDYCEKKLQEIKDSALSHLEILPSSEAKQALSDLVNWSTKKKKRKK